MKRINALLRNEISEILVNDMTDPRVGFVTVMDVETSKDLRTAEVFVSVMSEDDEEVKATLEALEHARGYIKALLADRVVLKFMPDLRFRLHEGARHASRIDALLNELNIPPASEDASED
jgi:ribosome-binding factor A